MRFAAAHSPILQDRSDLAPFAGATVDAQGVEDLLRKLARSRGAALQDTSPAKWIRSVVFPALSVCWFGYTLASHVWIMASDDSVIGVSELEPARADTSRFSKMLPESVQQVRVSASDVDRTRETPELAADALLMPLTFRGSLIETPENLSAEVSAQPAPQKSRRRAVRAKPVVVQAEVEQLEMNSPSLLEKLFGLRFPSS